MFYETNVRVLVKTKSRRKPPKTLCAFLFFLYFVGFDFGFKKCLNRQIRFVATTFSLAINVITAISILLYLIYSGHDIFWYLLIFFYYCAGIIVQKTSKYNLYDMIIDIINIDKRIAVPKINLVLFCTLFVITLHISMVTGHCIYLGPECLKPKRMYYTLGIVCRDIIAVVLFLIYYYIYRFVKMFKELVESSQITVKLMQQNYIKVCNCFDKIRLLYDKLIVIELLFGVPTIMGTCLLILKYLKYDSRWPTYFTEFVFASQFLLQRWLPIIAVEMVNCEVNRLKLVLHNQLIAEKDKARSEEMIRFLKHIEARHFQHLAWRVIPVNMRLMTSLISFCMTYIIVIIQFTHLYD